MHTHFKNTVLKREHEKVLVFFLKLLKLGHLTLEILSFGVLAILYNFLVICRACLLKCAKTAVRIEDLTCNEACCLGSEENCKTCAVLRLADAAKRNSCNC